MRDIAVAKFSIILSGSGINQEEIEAKLEIKATQMVKKGDVLNKLPLIEAEEDEWVYTEKLEAPEGEDKILRSLLQHLIDKKPEFMEIAGKCKIVLRLYIQSDYASMAYQLTPDTLRLFAELGMPLDVTSLSWGEVM